MNLPRQLIAAGLLLVTPTLAPAAEPSARWNPRTINWNVNPHLAIGDWGFDRPGYPPGLYIQGVTMPEGEKVTNPVIYDNDVFDDVFDDELAMVMASEGEMNLVGLIVTPVLTDGWGFSKPEWIKTAHEARRVAEQSGLRMERIPPITVGTEAQSEKAGEGKDSAGARLYIRLIHEQFARDPQRPLLVNIGGQGATLASACSLDPTIADQCIVYYTDLRVYNGHYKWASELIAKRFRVISWGDDHWWITKPGQNEWRVLPRPDKAEGKDNDANSGEWRQLTDLRAPLLDQMVKQFQTRGEYCRGARKGDGYLDGTFLHAWLPGIFEDAALQTVRGGQVLHVTRFIARNEDRVKAFANRRLLNPQVYRYGTEMPKADLAAPLRLSESQVLGNLAAPSSNSAQARSLDKMLTPSILAPGEPKQENPMLVNLDHAATTRWLNKKILASRLLDDMENPATWTLRNHGELSFTQERCRDGRQSVRITVPTLSDKANKVHGRAFGEATLCRFFQNEDWTAFNRLSFWVYPTMQGFKNGSMLAKLFYEGSDQEKVSIWYRGQMSYFLLRPGEWNHIVWEIPHVPRQKITRLELIYLQQGNEPGAATTVTLDIDHLELQRVDPDYYQGWTVAPGRIAFSHTGYRTGLSKTALASGLNSGSFSLLDKASGRSVLTKPIRREQTGLGEFQVMDFSEVETPGEYTLQAGALASQPFRIGPEVWETTIRKAINFFYAERCGCAVPGVHDVCHQDWQAKHNGQTIQMNGGWHDAGDLSQGEINTAEAIYAMLALAERLGASKPELAARLLVEARWGLDWLHKTRFGDGYRVVWGTMDFWSDGVVGNIDDCYGQVRNSAYDNLIGCAASALAARVFKDHDPALAQTSLSVARDDFRFAAEKTQSPGIELASQAALAAMELYRATGDRAYTEKAVEWARVIVASQQREFPSWDKPMVGFFYDGPKHQRVLNYAHRGHDQAPAVALAALCDALPDHPDWMQWYSAVVLQSEFRRATARLDAPYGTLAAGIYHVRENTNQVTKGLKLSEEYYLRRFPVTGDARGHYGVLLSQTKSLSAAARLRRDPSLLDVCQSQLQWIVGKNPFGQSCMYGEGYDYAPQYTAMSGDIVGSLPVGMMMPSDDDFPFWPAANCWAYKEVWVHPVSRWLWVLSDLFQATELRPPPLPDCAFDLTADAAAAGEVTLRLSARGHGRHRFSVRAENLAIIDPNQELDLKQDSTTMARWTASVMNTNAPWVAVVYPDGKLAQRRELTANINQP